MIDFLQTADSARNQVRKFLAASRIHASIMLLWLISADPAVDGPAERVDVLDQLLGLPRGQSGGKLQVTRDF
ncbi:hypothetical protein CWR43_13125 [Rhizobium sullae]|uniref:Uncharacterized protein n=1 Tax=Rhizobium sullae TaxID=50338 RepID=A0A2N0DA99_RHISU|nr:hypothetical protein CWR43_13125 [Rhizobium sullae]